MEFGIGKKRKRRKLFDSQHAELLQEHFHHLVVESEEENPLGILLGAKGV